jgi:hypothetical protein
MTIRTPRLRRTARAEQDLIDIWRYINRHNPQAADICLKFWMQKVKRLPPIHIKAWHAKTSPKASDTFLSETT